MQQKRIKHICFDLDGTLVDSLNTIYNSTVKTLRQLDIRDDIKKEDFKLLIGHHFVDMFNALGIPVIDMDHFIDIYKKNYFSFIDESRLYPDAEEILLFLKEKNISISLLTTKVQEQAEKIVDHFKLQNHFDEIMGRRPGIPVKPDPKPLFEICKSLKVEPEETLIIGDTELDIVCGKNAGSLTCCVTYGYREKEKLLKVEADYYINSLSNLKALLTNKNFNIN